MANNPPRTTKKSPEPTRSRSGEKHKFTRGLYGWITHTDLASLNPAATKAWCAEVLGWTFKPPFPVPGGEIHLFTYSEQGGGAVRPVNPPEIPGSIPYVHVADAGAAFAKAISAGADVEADHDC
jgi:predicted enzyme related to lactoylglutathione lyase